ncbi:MAG: hypothetical protein KKE05_00520 [Nanoarchaeota archaeon]|nr:hypothetical protein [Nanoarchaeota archaeon]
MEKQTKYEINLDKPLMMLSYALCGYVLVRAYTQENMFDLILYSCFFVTLTILVARDFRTYKPFIVKATSPNFR